MSHRCHWAVLLRFVSREDGQDLAEYVLLVGLIAVLVMAGIGSLGVALDAYLRAATERLQALL